MPRSGGEESLHRKQRYRKASEKHRRRVAPAPRAERIAAKSSQPQSSIAICTPSFSELRRAPGGGVARRAGEESLPTSNTAAALLQEKLLDNCLLVYRAKTGVSA